MTCWNKLFQQQKRNGRFLCLFPPSSCAEIIKYDVNKHAYMLGGENAMNLTRELTKARGRTWPSWKHSEDNRSKWRHNKCLRGVTITQPSDVIRAWWSIHGSFHLFVCVLEPEKHVRNKRTHGLPLIMSFWSLVRWFANNFHSWLCHSSLLTASHIYICIYIYKLRVYVNNVCGRW